MDNLLIIFTLLHIVFCVDQFLHLFLRFWLPEVVHPELSDVIPATADSTQYPLVAIQLPMMNEIGCCETIIECACMLQWPKSRLLIQVLDDSTLEEAKKLVIECVDKWATCGYPIKLYRRNDRIGFKAGSLIHGMKLMSNVDYIAIFDADFLPTPDFLYKTVPPLIRDPSIAFVQARWTFTNAKESFLTRMQEILLNFHHKCEQEGRFRSSLFFTFNGTGGVWRRSAIDSIGGWHTDTLVEDLDLSLRAYIYGWRSVYMHRVGCLNELPPTQSAYLSQQYRWHCGPMQVGRKIIPQIWRSNFISWYQKIYCVWYLFRSWIHIINFLSFVIIFPLGAWLSSVDAYKWISIGSSIINILCQMSFMWDEAYLIPMHIAFMNVMCLNNACAILAGVFGFRKAKQWIVTQKVGCMTGVSSYNACKSGDVTQEKRCYSSMASIFFLSSWKRWLQKNMKQNLRISRLYKRYVVIGSYLFIMSFLAHRKLSYFNAFVMMITSIMYFIMGFGWFGQPNP